MVYNIDKTWTVGPLSVSSSSVVKCLVKEHSCENLKH